MSSSIGAVGAFGAPDACPCGTGRPYDECCGVFHRGEADAPTAVTLMRARYSAYAMRDVDYVFRTWHPATRPPEASLRSELQWRHLDIDEVVNGSEHDDLGEVTYAAFYTDPQGHDGCLREHSRFVRKGPRWVYLEGEVEARGSQRPPV